jgi:hypothetical protein
MMLAGFVALVSCKETKTADDCIYKLANAPNDDTFYISYELDGVPHIYYQLGHAGHAGMTGSTPITINGEGYTITNCRSSYEFDDLIAEGTEITYKPSAVYLIFQNIQSIKKGSEIKPWHELNLWNYAFTYAAPGEMYVKDTAYMTGVALNLVTTDSTSYSTQNILTFFKFDYPTVFSDVLNPDDNFLNITNIVPLEDDCIGNYIIEGTFATTVSTYVNPDAKPIESEDGTVTLPKPTYMKVTNGSFKFLTQ